MYSHTEHGSKFRLKMLLKIRSTIFSTKQLHWLILRTFSGFGEVGFGEMGFGESGFKKGGCKHSRELDPASTHIPWRLDIFTRQYVSGRSYTRMTCQHVRRKPIAVFYWQSSLYRLSALSCHVALHSGSHCAIPCPSVCLSVRPSVRPMPPIFLK